MSGYGGYGGGGFNNNNNFAGGNAGGFNNNQNQFSYGQKPVAGGFFQASPSNNFNSPIGTDKKRGNESQLRPLTLKQILTSKKSAENNTWKIDDVEVTQVSIIGKITAVNITSTNIRYTIEDGTGSIDITKWIDRVEDPDEMQMDTNPSAYGEGQYIKCYGHLREFKGKHQIAATNLGVIGHPDEITFHFLECIYVHLELTKGRINGGNQYQQQQYVHAPTSGGLFQQAPPQTFQQNHEVGRLEGTILQYLGSVNCPEGVDVRDIFNALRSVASESQIQECIDQLKNEGHVYETSDPQHISIA